MSFDHLDHSTSWTAGATGLTAAAAAPSSGSDGTAFPQGASRLRLRSRTTAGSVTAQAWRLWTYGGSTAGWSVEADSAISGDTDIAVEYAVDAKVTRFYWQLTSIAGGGTLANSYRVL